MGQEACVALDKVLEIIGVQLLCINIYTTQDVFCKLIPQMLKFWKLKTKMVEAYLFK
jgi:hypothetical protein